MSDMSSCAEGSVSTVADLFRVDRRRPFSLPGAGFIIGVEVMAEAACRVLPARELHRRAIGARFVSDSGVDAARKLKSTLPLTLRLLAASLLVAFLDPCFLVEPRPVLVVRLALPNAEATRKLFARQSDHDGGSKFRKHANHDLRKDGTFHGLIRAIDHQPETSSEKVEGGREEITIQRGLRGKGDRGFSKRGVI